MLSSVLLQFFSDYSEYEEKVRCRNKESVYRIIQQLIDNGPDSLQVYECLISELFFVHFLHLRLLINYVT